MVSLVEKRDLQGYLKRRAYVASSPINDSVLGGSFDNSAVLDSPLNEQVKMKKVYVNGL